MDAQSRKSRRIHNSLFFLSLLVSVLFSTAAAAAAAEEENSSDAQKCASSCGNIELKHPLGPGEGCGASPFSQLLTCDEGKQLRLRTDSGLFDVQHVDYDKKTMTITDPQKSRCSPVSGISVFAPDTILQPTARNTIILFDCPANIPQSLCTPASAVDCSALYSNCGGGSGSANGSCCATEFWRLGEGGLKGTGCGRYASLFGLDGGGWGYGIRISFDVVPDEVNLRLCAECERPDGSCGVALRCICFPRACRAELLGGAAACDSISKLTVMGLSILWIAIIGMVL